MATRSEKLHQMVERGGFTAEEFLRVYDVRVYDALVREGIEINASALTAHNRPTLERIPNLGKEGLRTLLTALVTAGELSDDHLIVRWEGVSAYVPRKRNKG